jgi:hypothetical protein
MASGSGRCARILEYRFRSELVTASIPTRIFLAMRIKTRKAYGYDGSALSEVKDGSLKLAPFGCRGSFNGPSHPFAGAAQQRARKKVQRMFRRFVKSEKRR